MSERDDGELTIEERSIINISSRRSNSSNRNMVSLDVVDGLRPNDVSGVDLTASCCAAYSRTTALNKDKSLAF